MTLIFFKKGAFFSLNIRIFGKRVYFLSIFNILKQATFIGPSSLQENQHFVEKGSLLRHQICQRCERKGSFFYENVSGKGYFCVLENDHTSSFYI